MNQIILNTLLAGFSVLFFYLWVKEKKLSLTLKSTQTENRQNRDNLRELNTSLQEEIAEVINQNSQLRKKTRELYTLLQSHLIACRLIEYFQVPPTVSSKSTKDLEDLLRTQVSQNPYDVVKYIQELTASHSDKALQLEEEIDKILLVNSEE